MVEPQNNGQGKSPEASRSGRFWQERLQIGVLITLIGLGGAGIWKVVTYFAPRAAVEDAVCRMQLQINLIETKQELRNLRNDIASAEVDLSVAETQEETQGADSYSLRDAKDKVQKLKNRERWIEAKKRILDLPFATNLPLDSEICSKVLDRLMIQAEKEILGQLQ